jgi:hypothetical protein
VWRVFLLASRGASERHSAGRVQGLNPLVAITLRYRGPASLLVCLRSESSLTGVEYMRYDVLCSDLLGPCVSWLLQQPQRCSTRPITVDALRARLPPMCSAEEVWLLLRLLPPPHGPWHII